MKLLRRVLVLMEAELAGEPGRVPGVGIAFSTRESTLADPRPELVAIDVHFVSTDDEPEEWRTVERAAIGPDDLGNVYDREGKLLGRVTARDGSLVTWTPSGVLTAGS